MRRLGIIAALVASTQAMPAHAQSRQEHTRVIMVYSHNPNSPGVVAFAGQLKSVVREKVFDAEIYDEYLDVDRFFDPAHTGVFTDYFSAKYRRFQPDAIVAEG